MEDRFVGFLRARLAPGPMTLEALHRELAAEIPGLGVRGPQWLSAQLARSQAVIFDGARYSLREADEDEPEELVLEAQDADAGPAPLELQERCVVFDLETNADRHDAREHEIIEIAAARLERGRVVERFHQLVVASRPLCELTVETTGLTDQALTGAVPLEAVLPKFVEFVGADPVVAHNGLGYDFLVLDAACTTLDTPPPQGVRLDTLDLAHLIFPRAGDGLTVDIHGEAPVPGRQLGQLAEALDVETDGEAHRADVDVELLAGVLRELLRRLQADDAAPSRWVLEQVAHPWLFVIPAVLDQPPVPSGERPELLDVVPKGDAPPWTPPSGEFDVADAIGPLQPGGVVVEGRTHRPQQVDLARHTARAFAYHERLLVEAPTGTGKTLGYLVPAVAYARAGGGPVIIATHSKVLQNQVLSEIELLSSCLGPLSAVLLKGQENYLSLEMLDGALDAVEPDPDDAFALATILRWAAVTPTGEWDDLRTWAIDGRSPALARLRWQLRVDNATSIASDELEGRCFYRRAREGVADADLAVLNHAVLVSRNDWKEHAASLIVDEAHNLEESATTALTDEVTEQDVYRLLRSVLDRGRRRGALLRWCEATGTPVRGVHAKAATDAVRVAGNAAEQLSATLTDFLRSRAGARRDELERFGASIRLSAYERRRPGFAAVRAAAVSLAASLRDLASQLSELPVPAQLRGRYRRHRLEQELSRAGRRLRDAAETVYLVIAGSNDPVEDAAWIPVADLRIEDGSYTWGLRRVPLSVAPGLRDLWDELDSVVLTSATLRVGGGFTFIQEQLGMELARPVALTTPFERMTEQTLVWLTDHLPAPTGGLMDAFTTAQTDELARLLTLSHGRALALFAARSRMQHAADHLKGPLEQLGLTVMCQGDAPAPALIERMRAEPNTSLLATRSFWEGIDIPGDALSLLVVEKLPFDSPGDPVLAARMEHLELRGKDSFAELLVPRAAIRFAQGMGRLVRTATDRGAAVVLDKRLRRPVGYREAFLRSLPGPPTFMRPLSPEEGYQLVADHLGLPFDAAVLARMASLPSSDPWSILDDLQLSDDEAHDPGIVTDRLEQVRAQLGFGSWRPGQLEVMLRLIRGEDVLAILPTGSGKSLTFQLPALLRPGLTLVVSPLIALMRDQVRKLQEHGIVSVGSLRAGQSLSEQEDVLVAAQAGRLRLLYVSPERLWTQRFRSAVRNVHIARVIVDEAHCVSEWGHTFRPEYGDIVEAVEQIVGGRAQRPTVGAVTATATAEVQRELVASLELPETAPIIADPDRPELHYHVVDCIDNDDRELMVIRIAEAFRGRSMIIYAPRIRQTTELAALLRAANHRARAYHGSLESEERTHVEEAFLDGGVDIIVATKAFGLGIDKPDVAAVMHLEMPASVEEYVQETGRTARGAQAEDRPPTWPDTGICILLRTPQDCQMHSWFIKQAAPGREVLENVYGAIAPSYVGPLEDLLPEQDEEQVGLAVSYLVRGGYLERGEDLAWEGRVLVLGDARDVLAQYLDQDPELVRRGRALLAKIDRVGREEYDAVTWSRQIGIEPDELEGQLLELSRRGVLGFVSWRSAVQLRRTDARPDWQALDEAVGRRRRRVEDLSRNAKAYRRQDEQCRRSWLLWYLDAEADGSCDGCDVCVPDLPAPWHDVEVSREDLTASLPAAVLILDLALRLEPFRFGRGTLEKVLLGEELIHNPHVAEEPSYGALRLLKRGGVAAKVDELIDAGLLEQVAVDRDDRSYILVRPTQGGRELLVT